MVVCNACKTVGKWSGKTLLNMDGTIHRCLKGKIFTYHHLQYEYIEDGKNPDPNVARQVRLEGNTWTLYHFGEVFEILRRDRK